MKLAIIVATDDQGLIGKDNYLPWKLSADLQYFRRVTMGKPIIMGRNTHDSIGRVLPGRKNIIVTKNIDYQAEGCTVVHSVNDALLACEQVEEAMVMGGASVYEQFLPKADKLYLTQVHASVSGGDTWFPEWYKNEWSEISREDYLADDKNVYDYSFIVYEKVKK
ncbi:MAG: dihydrofolate reductase [Psychromonas sp.]|jgi:dihydrofolate reductase|uniref:dihydrofolate reductase n=1 Tax=Psychromonas sp. TaxID=1884585 RepID=UPI0039E63E0E